MSEATADKFKAFIKITGLTRKAVAERIGVSGAALSGYLSGKTNPRPLVRERIRIFTRGKIQPHEWASPDELELLASVKPWSRSERTGTEG
jgi:transcriptional regulator with XRE-family HTH domain